jgi:hypothetical protein
VAKQGLIPPRATRADVKRHSGERGANEQAAAQGRGTHAVGKRDRQDRGHGTVLAQAGGGGDDWKSRKNASAASAFTLTELRLARYRMLSLREKLVSSQPVDEYVEMEILRTVKR